MSEFWTTTDNIYDLFPKWKADYTNHFIERSYITVDEFERLSEIQKEKCNEDGGIILNRKSFDDAEMYHCILTENKKIKMIWDLLADI